MITLNNISYSIGSKNILRNIDRQLEQGQYGLIGEKGAGKTTLLKLIAKLIKPTKGLIDSHLPLCYISSDYIDFGRDLNLIYYLRLAQHIYSISPQSYRQFEEILQPVIDGKRICDLSLENRQKILLLPLFSQNRYWYLLDNTFSAIDQASKNRLIHFLKEKASSYILASHHTCDIFSLSEQLILVTNQRLHLLDSDELPRKISYIATILLPNGQTIQRPINQSELAHLAEGHVVNIKSVLDA